MIAEFIIKQVGGSGWNWVCMALQPLFNAASQAQAGSMCEEQFLPKSSISLARLGLLSPVGTGLLKPEILSSMPNASCLQDTLWWVILLQNRLGRVVLNDIKDPPFFSGGFLPRARFTLPAARGKMSLNARDW